MKYPRAPMRDFEVVPIDAVRDFWNRRPCNIRHSPKAVGSREYFDEVEARKYFVEPHIPSFADFPRWKGRRVLEIGCGIGTATISFLRAGARVTAVDLSDESLELARRRAEVYGLADRATFVEADAERLSQAIEPETYDLVYSFGVLHHTPHPEKAIDQIRAFVRPGSTLKLMMYHSRSWKVFWAVLRHGAGRFWDWRRIIARYSEAQTGCPVTYTYNKRELKEMLEARGFRVVDMFVDHIFPYRISDYVEYRYRKEWYFAWMPPALFRWLERHFGWHLCATAVVPGKLPVAQPAALIADDPIISQFKPYSGDVDAKLSVNFLGQKTDPGFGFPSSAAGLNFYPEINDEVFEWIAVLEAVLEARTNFTMLELGAGYGRWLVAAVCALRQKHPNVPFKLVAIEPEPAHFCFLRQHFTDNAIDPDNHTLIQAAVNDTGEPVHFIAGHSTEWYGQAIVPQGYTQTGYPQARTIQTPAVKLVNLLNSHEYIDLLDADIQGAEVPVITSSMQALTKTTRRAYISTHSADIHSTLAQAFHDAGWHQRALHGWRGENEPTRFGPLTFIDGIQYWLNPHVGPGDETP